MTRPPSGASAWACGRSSRRGNGNPDIGHRRTLAFLRNARRAPVAGVRCSDGLSDFKPSVPSGGRAGGGGGFYHLSFRSGSRAGGASARAAFDYVSRRDEYADRDLDEAVYTESEHMPSWAEDDPEQFWDAADLYERANGRLYVSADFALPRDLLGRGSGRAGPRRSRASSPTTSASRTRSPSTLAATTMATSTIPTRT